MRKRTRPNFLRHLEKRYGRNREVLDDATRPVTPPPPPDGHTPPRKPGKVRLPRVYPVTVRQSKPVKFKEPKPVKFKEPKQPKQPKAPRPQVAASKGVIDMSIQQFVTLAICFVLLAWAGSGAVALGVVGLTGGGPEGDIGPPGPVGERGVAGPIGDRGPPGDEASQEMIKRLATLWSVQQASGVRGGAFVELNDSQVTSCVDYVLNGEGSVGSCPGFSAGGGPPDQP